MKTVSLDAWIQRYTELSALPVVIDRRWWYSGGFFLTTIL